MERKARYIGKAFNKFDHTYTPLFYEYRGHEYQVTAPQGWTASSDYYTGYMRLSEQHKREQERIDAQIEAERLQEQTPPAQQYKGSWEEGLDIFMDFVNQ